MGGPSSVDLVGFARNITVAKNTREQLRRGSVLRERIAPHANDTQLVNDLLAWALDQVVTEVGAGLFTVWRERVYLRELEVKDKRAIKYERQYRYKRQRMTDAQQADKIGGAAEAMLDLVMGNNHGNMGYGAADEGREEHGADDDDDEREHELALGPDGPAEEVDVIASAVADASMRVVARGGARARASASSVHSAHVDARAENAQYVVDRGVASIGAQVNRNNEIEHGNHGGTGRNLHAVDEGEADEGAIHEEDDDVYDESKGRDETEEAEGTKLGGVVDHDEDMGNLVTHPEL
jgi:hypothetical protein